MDKFLARTLGIGVLLVGAGVFYYFVIYKPAQDRAALGQRQEHETTYKQCVYNANQGYASSWAHLCKQVAENKQRLLKNCLATPSIVNNPYLGQQWCEQQYGGIDSSSQCPLPMDSGNELNHIRSENIKQCEAAFKVGS